MLGRQTGLSSRRISRQISDDFDRHLPELLRQRSIIGIGARLLDIAIGKIRPRDWRGAGVHRDITFGGGALRNALEDESLAEAEKYLFGDRRTDAGSDSSQATAVVLPGTNPQVVIAFSAVRAAPITCAPRSASTRIASKPRPELQPVMRMVLPASGRPVVTSSAVEL
jgi:hypothetical protein